MSDGVRIEPVAWRYVREDGALWLLRLRKPELVCREISETALYTSDAIQTAVAAERARIEGFLQDPAAVHVNLLRGGIARPSAATIWHIYGRQLLDAMPAEFAAIEGTESPCHG